METGEFSALSKGILERTGSVFVGEEQLLGKLLCAALANGHVLFEDNPGLGKTLLAKTFSKVIGCKWGRVQFTPDLMPADILGTRVWRPRESEFYLEKGPIFTNILLADEINRAPPKTQAALLEAMEERQVTIEGTTHVLEAPFFVIATQNPIEHEGTFPLPEAQMDRFLMRLSLGYVNTLQQESEILRRRLMWRKDNPLDTLQPFINNGQMLEMQRLVENDIYVDDSILDYVSNIVRSTRKDPAVEVGSSPRGSLALLKLSRAHAALSGRNFVTPDDVKIFAHDALGHRIILKMEYEIDEELTPTVLVDRIIASVEAPKEYRKKV